MKNSPKDNSELDSSYRKICLGKLPLESKTEFELEETCQACQTLTELMLLRQKYIFYDQYTHQHPFLSKTQGISQVPVFKKLAENKVRAYMHAGVFHLSVNSSPVNLEVVPPSEFFSDLFFVEQVANNTVVNSFCCNRLKLLSMKFSMHTMLNSDREHSSSTDFVNLVKVNNYLSLSRTQTVLEKPAQEVLKGSSKTEISISIHGKKQLEWGQLANWFVTSSLEFKTAKFLIKIPRNYKTLKEKGAVSNFEELLSSIFTPIFKATLEPQELPNLSKFLQEVVGFDCADQKSSFEKVVTLENYKEVPPKHWNTFENPPYSYWVYYIYANLTVLNHLRRAKGLNTFALRPHCVNGCTHFSSAFLVAHSVNKGTYLSCFPVLQYLYYLMQIGISTSALSAHSFSKMFASGLNLSLSPGKALHLTKDPLSEEYSLAMHVLGLSPVDLCEISNNSILQSGFALSEKAVWLGFSGVRGSYRFETFATEHLYVNKHC